MDFDLPTQGMEGLVNFKLAASRIPDAYWLGSAKMVTEHRSYLDHFVRNSGVEEKNRL